MSKCHSLVPTPVLFGTELFLVNSLPLVSTNGLFLNQLRQLLMEASTSYNALHDALLGSRSMMSLSIAPVSEGFNLAQ